VATAGLRDGRTVRVCGKDDSYAADAIARVVKSRALVSKLLETWLLWEERGRPT
jgi:hypothetical protein